MFTQRSFYTAAFTQRSDYCTQRAFTHKRICTQKCLVFTQRSLYTEELLHTRAFTQRSCYTQMLLHKEVFTQRALTNRRVYKQKLLHKEVFAERACTHGSFHTQSFYIEKPLHPGAFGKKPSPLAPRKKRSSMIP